MAEVAVKKAAEQKTGGEQGATGSEQGVTKQNQTGVSRQGAWDPLSLWNPSEFFSNPFLVMRRLSEEMDRNFGRFLGQEEGGSFWSPVIEVSQREGQLRVHAELPGLKPEDVHIEVANDQLIIQGERKSEQQQRDKGVYRSERRYGRFYRAVPLPEGTSTENAKAQFNNGVLEISIPVPEQKSNRRQIPIESK
jgi:HSP20 family protein